MWAKREFAIIEGVGWERSTVDKYEWVQWHFHELEYLYKADKESECSHKMYLHF